MLTSITIKTCDVSPGNTPNGSAGITFNTRYQHQAYVSRLIIGITVYSRFTITI